MQTVTWISCLNCGSLLLPTAKDSSCILRGLITCVQIISKPVIAFSNQTVRTSWLLVQILISTNQWRSLNFLQYLLSLSCLILHDSKLTRLWVNLSAVFKIWLQWEMSVSTIPSIWYCSWRLVSIRPRSLFIAVLKAGFLVYCNGFFTSSLPTSF